MSAKNKILWGKLDVILHHLHHICKLIIFADNTCIPIICRHKWELQCLWQICWEKIGHVITGHWHCINPWIMVFFLNLMLYSNLIPCKCNTMDIIAALWILMTSCFNSSPPIQNGHYLADDILECIFLNEKFRILIWISLKIVPEVPIDNMSAWFR